jgi:amino acid permease
LPYGIVLFSFWGISTLPDLKDMLGRNKNSLTKVIVFSTLTALVVYSLFVLSILSLAGDNVDQSALGGLSPVVGRGVERALLTLGIAATFTSYLGLGLALTRLLMYDLKAKKIIGVMAISVVPAIMYFLGVNNFITVISFVGSVMLAIDGIFITCIYVRARRPVKIARGFAAMIALCFVLGIIYEIYKIL